MDRHSITPSMIEAWKGDAAGMQEKQLRQFAARRAIELGYGGIAFVSEALGINRKTIRLRSVSKENRILHLCFYKSPF